MDKILQDLTEGLDLESLLATSKEMKEKAMKQITNSLTPEVRASMTKEQLEVSSNALSALESNEKSDLKESLNSLTKLVEGFENMYNKTK